MKTHIAMNWHGSGRGYSTRCGRIVMNDVTGRRGPFKPEMDLCRTCRKAAENMLAFHIECDTEALDELRSHVFREPVDGSET